ncbi:PIR Superfamily Protein [Plasmodium ovale curtisi]|uniref:PIR Superfamily Protein n=1 Tax=Plasmodium ovale curtisi TaxID=864141 RepID=A0A1A8X6D2_PLAOA|nr:PIR Superfamily Protein [Plasmodium ovale curtisi]SBT00806.1 PIR Superfamily Protein [Plasmodium ovale curtisi]
MVSSQQDGEYLSFDEYNDYKRKLNDSYAFEEEENEYASFFISALPEDREKYNAILNNCFIIKKYLLKFISDESCNSGQCCSYMNYWLNEKIGGSNHSLIESDFDIYNNYIAYYNRNHNKKLCESNKIFIRTDIFEEMKKLYDLYGLYNNLETTSSYANSKCIQLKSCVSHYNSILSKCKHTANSDFCKPLQNFKKIFSPDKFVSISECEKKFGDLKLKELQDLPELDVQQVDFLFIQGNRESVRRGTVIQTLFFSTVGIFLLFLLSYKFTPFGKWIRSVLSRKNAIKYYEAKERTQDILSHTYNHMNVDTGDIIHNMRYHAAQFS